MKQKINICLIQPIGYIHSLALLELAEYLQHTLESLGNDVHLQKNRFDNSRLNIILGAHLIDDHKSLPERSIIFNSEQFGYDNNWTKGSCYTKILEENYVWDYSQVNVRSLNSENYSIIEIGYHEKLMRLQDQIPREYDLLFYGSMNKDRENTIKRLEQRGIKVKCIFELYSKERDYFLERSRAVLNLHYYKSQVFQQVRAFYPLTNNIPVISEDFSSESAPAFYQSCIFKPNGEDFIDYVDNLFRDKEKFFNDSLSLLEEFKKSSGKKSIKDGIINALSYFDSRQKITQKNAQEARSINLGSGKDYRPNYLNIDIRESVSPDLIIDLSKRIKFPSTFSGFRGNSITLSTNYFYEIFVNDVLEHVNDLEQLMTNCLALLVEGGQMKISVPYDLSFGAWQDPTHVRGFNQNSWLYYTDWFWYLGWFEHRFEMTELTYIPSALGNKLLNDNNPQETVLRTPRAIDSMLVTLTKRKTSLEEKTRARSYIVNLYP